MNPENTALVYGETSVTYGQLEAQSNQLARYLSGLGLPPYSRIALCLDRTRHLLKYFKHSRVLSAGWQNA